MLDPSIVLVVAGAAVVSGLCATVSAARVWIAAAPTAVHPRVLASWVRSASPRKIEALASDLARWKGGDWEHDLFVAALSAPAVRAALVDEQLAEFDRRLQRWSRVPRVAARVATTMGFLFATVLLRVGLAGEVSEAALIPFAGGAVASVALGFAGMAFSVGAHAQAKRLVTDRLRAADELVDALLSRDEPAGIPSEMSKETAA